MLKPILSAAFFNTIAPGYKCSIEELFQILLKIAAKTYASESLLGKVSKCWFLDYLWIAAFISVESTDFFFKKNNLHSFLNYSPIYQNKPAVTKNPSW